MIKSWSEEGIKKIKTLKIAILKKKIMLNFLVDSYAWWDKAYRWAHIGVATTAPLVSIYEALVVDSDNIRIINIVLGCVVAGMLKLKEYIMYDKIRDVAKSQTIKYTQLFERIEAENRKPADRKQIEDEFIYWVNREFANISMNDPELSHNDKTQFRELCKQHGIPYDEDLTELQQLMDINTPVACMATGTLDTTVDENGLKINSTSDTNEVQIDVKPDNNTDNLPSTDNNTDDLSSVDVPKLQDIKSAYATPVKTSRSRSTERNLTQHKILMKKMDTKADLQWAMERLNNLDTDD